MAVAVSSASGLLSLLEEDDEGLRLHALQALNKVAHEFWFQIAGSIASVEAFYEDEEFSHRELAALVASKARSTTASCPVPCTAGPFSTAAVHVDPSSSIELASFNII